ncbi:type VII secretion-associated serine protease mycosin [Mycolicibacterium sp. OfavD-34-C]|uniref:type VII secretion-associated serine protease mycosin n=1 Tax=Mycolicibacterium sp. OfavD-34-C TaxID=2917746 RepID=UPI001EF4990A|nr:type VII secretion-associated serine protease mycosin [Mycolicibacterium sp. OfavD-34-C]MCG7579089.1 type VII secretion-associated serine protease mycosin [Mycolicibacterium sp. OfavD-34-C]
MKAVRTLAAATLVAAAVWTPPCASAVTPPPVDENLLPAPAPPGPPQPTTRFGDCVTADPTASDTGGQPGQVAGQDLGAVWALTRGAGQTVAVIDTGVARHRRLPHLRAGGDYVSSGDGTDDCDGHGTAVAAIIGAAPEPTGNRFTGIAPDVSIMAIRQSSNKFRADTDLAGSGYGDVATLAAAVRTAADLGATVINISSVACLPADAALDDRALGAALAYAVDVKNVVVVTAAGNTDGPGQCPAGNPDASSDWADVAVVASPAWYDDYVLTVASVGPGGLASPFTLAGPWVDVAAPGEDVVSLAAAGDDTVRVSGTSYAAPTVSAVAALVRARYPELTARQVMRRIEDTARHPGAGWSPEVGHGLVDALAAVSGGSSPHPTPVAAPLTLTPAAPVTDTGARDSALRAAGICVALSVAVAAGARSRRRRDPVPGD